MLKLIEGKTTKAERPESKITFIQKVIKDETWLVMAQSAVELEDEFSSLYYTAGQQNNLFLMPPFEPNVLLNLVQTNNVLNQCIEAMEVNIDGTGHEFVPMEEGEDIDPEEEKLAKGFFDEPYPNVSMTGLRRKLRRQMESVGYGFVEVLRNIAGDVVGLRSVETAHIRMVKLDLPIQVKKKIERDGTEVELVLWERERRFAQTVALKQQVYYREFGTTREINRNTGEWETDDKKIPPELRGSELLILGINPDVTTPYYLPRWINELPSVIGSRAAEEQNLQFLDAGGLPPAIVFIQGGTLIKDTSDQLRMYLSGLNKNKNRAVVVEVQSSSGSLDAAGKVDVKVERFGCVDDQTEVLTWAGWVPIAQWDGQQIATDVQGVLQYQKPAEVHRYPYKGQMVHIEGHATEFCVTPNHRVWYEPTHDQRSRRFELALNTYHRSNIRIPVASPGGLETEVSTSLTIGSSSYAWPIFLDFLGMFISDGSTQADADHAKKITLSVKKYRKRVFIDAFAASIADAAGGTLAYSEDSAGYGRYCWTAQELRNWLRFEVGATACVKRIPPVCLQLPQMLSERLLLALMQGDGHYNGADGKDGWTYTTTSPRLADDVQQLCLHAGYRSIVSQVAGRAEWCVSITPKTIAHVTAKKCPTWTLEPYDGEVFCFTMPSGVFVTRRHGKVCITGNSAQSQDSMFTNYDEVTEEHIRVGFRLPPLFLGKAADYNFATAQTAYMVAEAQVFAPERTEFDELMNKTIIKELKLKSLKFKSKPITLKDVASQLAGLQLAAPVATRESFLKELNTVTSMSMELAAMPHPNVAPGQSAPGDTIADIPHEQLPAGMKPPVITSPQPEPKEPEPPKETHVVLKPGDEMHPTPKPNQTIMAKPKERKAAGELLSLAQEYALLKDLIPTTVQKQDRGPEWAAAVEQTLQTLHPDDVRAFNSLLAMLVFGSDEADLSAVIAASRA